MVTVEQVNVERYRRKYPHIDVFVGQEREQAAANAKHDGPIGEDGEPAYVGPDVVGMSVVENLYRPAVCQDEPAGKSQAVDHEPCGLISSPVFWAMPSDSISRTMAESTENSSQRQMWVSSRQRVM